MVDFIIIGQGLAGSILSYTLLNKGYSVQVIDDNKPNTATKVAAGLFNPITGKRLVKSWLVDELFAYSKDFYSALESSLKKSFFYEMPILKPIQTVEEQNFFFSKSADSSWSDYVSIYNTCEFDYVNSSNGYAIIHKAGWVNTSKMKEAMQAYLKNENAFIQTNFSTEELLTTEAGIEWKGIKAKKIIFCDGFRSIYNPYFSYLPFRVTKGEQLIIKADLPRNQIINKGVFIVPLEDDKFLVGATSELTDENEVTEKGKEKLIEKLDRLITVPYTIIDQKSGIRPTVADRKPIIGFHPTNPRIGVFNGMGTKGVSLAPLLAKEWVESFDDGGQVRAEVQIERYHKHFQNTGNS
ncbi:MAG: NAD(P)/FAD-dependent oxidoreductase [Cyclobacteriaceae bacterium]